MKIKTKDSAEKKYFLMQKAIGVLAIIFGIIGSLLMEEAAALILFGAIGTLFLFSKDKILMLTDTYWEENPVNRKNYPKI